MKKYFLTLFVCVGLLPFLAAEKMEFYTLLSQPIGIFKEAETQHDTTVSNKFKVGLEGLEDGTDITISAGTFGNSDNKIKALVVESGAKVKINRLDDGTLKNVNAARGDSTSEEYVAGIVTAGTLSLTANTTTKLASFDSMTIKETAKLDTKVPSPKNANWTTICQKGSTEGRTVLTTASANCSGDTPSDPPSPPPATHTCVLDKQDDNYVVYDFECGSINPSIDWSCMASRAGVPATNFHKRDELSDPSCWPEENHGSSECSSCESGAAYIDYSDCTPGHYDSSNNHWYCNLQVATCACQ